MSAGRNGQGSGPAASRNMIPTKDGRGTANQRFMRNELCGLGANGIGHAVARNRRSQVKPELRLAVRQRGNLSSANWRTMAGFSQAMVAIMRAAYFSRQAKFLYVRQTDWHTTGQGSGRILVAASTRKRLRKQLV